MSVILREIGIRIQACLWQGKQFTLIGFEGNGQDITNGIGDSGTYPGYG